MPTRNQKDSLWNKVFYLFIYFSSFHQILLPFWQHYFKVLSEDFFSHTDVLLDFCSTNLKKKKNDWEDISNILYKEIYALK